MLFGLNIERDGSFYPDDLKEFLVMNVAELRERYIYFKPLDAFRVDL